MASQSHQILIKKVFVKNGSSARLCCSFYGAFEVLEPFTGYTTTGSGPLKPFLKLVVPYLVLLCFVQPNRPQGFDPADYEVLDMLVQ